MDRTNLLEIAEAAEQSGDFETALEAYQLYDQTEDEGRSLTEQAEGGIETALSIGSGIIAEPIAGLAGVAQAMPDYSGPIPFLLGQMFPDKSADDIVEATREALTYQPRSQAGQENMQAVGEALQPVAQALEVPAQYLGDAAYDATGSPALAAAAYSIPTAALEIAGVKGGSIASKIPGRQAELKQAQAQELQSEVDAIRGQTSAEDAPTMEGMQSAADTISKASDNDLQALIQADPELYDAFDRLGIAGEIPTELVSTNPQYVELMGGLMSIPASELKIPFNNVIDQIAKADGRADNIIQELGGTTDKADLSDRFRESVTDTVDELYEAETAIYDNIDIKGSERFRPSNTLKLIEDEIQQVGGFSKLPAPYKAAYSKLKSKSRNKKQGVDVVTGKTSQNVEVPTTYANFTNQRQVVGSQIGKKVDQIESFKGVGEGKLKLLYSAMKEDQSDFMKQKGFNNEIDAADKLTIKRKEIEQNAKDILGKKLENGLANIVESRVKGLAKGEVGKFRATMAKIPKAYRQEAAATALNSLFKGSGEGQGAFSAASAAKNLDNLYRNKTSLNALLAELPPNAKDSLDALYKISKQIKRVNDNKIKTGAIKLFDSDSGLIAKMAGKGLAAAATKTTGSLAAGSAINDILTSKTPRADSAAKLLASPQFTTMIRDAVREGVYDGKQASSKLEKSEKLLEQSSKYKDWADTLNDSEKLRLANLGFIGYITQDNEQ